MAFGFQNTGSGDITPFIKFNAKAGRMIRVDRVQGAQGWTAEEVDISDNFSAIMDLENIQVGWVYYGPQGPQRVMSTYLKEPMPPQPQDKGEDGKLLYKQGFSVRMVLSKASGGGIREFGSSAASAVEAMGELHDAFLMGPGDSDRTLPVVKLAGSTPIKGNYGTNYRPNFEIVKWVDRPEELSFVPGNPTEVKANIKAAFNAGTSAPATGSTVKMPPKSKVTPPWEDAPAPATADADDF